MTGYDFWRKDLSTAIPVSMVEGSAWLRGEEEEEEGKSRKETNLTAALCSPVWQNKNRSSLS